MRDTVPRALCRALRFSPKCKTASDRLPPGRVLVRFDYPTLTGPGSRGWLLIERGDAEVCEKHPGGEEHLVVVVADPVAFARWHLGELRWADALRSGTIEVQGTRTLARTLPTWHRDPQRGPQPLHPVEPAGSSQQPASASLAVTEFDPALPRQLRHKSSGGVEKP